MKEPENHSCQWLITAAVIVTQDDGRRILDNGAVAVADGRVTAVGPVSDFADLSVEKRLDLGNALLMPGLINAHTHVSMTFFRGLADDLPLMKWLTEYIFPREQRLDPDIVELGALLGCAEMLRTGATSFADMYLFEDAVAAAVDKAGLRCLLGEAVFAFPTPASATAEESLARIRRQAERYKAHPRLSVAVMPHTVYTTTPEILAACRDLADDLKLPVHIHLAETRSEVESCLEQHGRRPVAYCRDLGLLRPSTSVAHGVELNDGELDILAQAGVTVAHNPRSNMKLASGVAPVPGMLSRGMLPALGTDGAASNNALNMFAEMSACALLHKVRGLDPTLCPAQIVLDMATLGGAKALGLEGLGRITPGAPADMIALDLSSPNLQPLYRPVSHLVYAASGHEVMMTMVDGRPLYHNGQWLTIDYPLLLKEAAKLKKWAGVPSMPLSAGAY
ncbi:MAG: amidohydrolase [Desulfovibrio sp.]|jgi:5-methylthioadenosine/S-adenosylhomocysteine deaminase|nr:amidohydrolase [Desulfovibrio sp.]